jgi:hypothetical protein
MLTREVKIFRTRSLYRLAGTDCFSGLTRDGSSSPNGVKPRSARKYHWMMIHRMTSHHLWSNHQADNTGSKANGQLRVPKEQGALRIRGLHRQSKLGADPPAPSGILLGTIDRINQAPQEKKPGRKPRWKVEAALPNAHLRQPSHRPSWLHVLATGRVLHLSQARARAPLAKGSHHLVRRPLHYLHSDPWLQLAQSPLPNRHPNRHRYQGRATTCHLNLAVRIRTAQTERTFSKASSRAW